MFINKTIPLALCFSLVMSGCASTNSEQGAAIGAIAGAVLGKATGNHKDKRMVFGAAIGAIAGAAIGDYMDKQEQEFRQELSNSGITLKREGDNLRLIMPANVTFATGQSYISANFHHTLDDIAKILVKYDKTLLQIDGHTDNVGTVSFNQSLSEQRADSVKNYLVNKQILSARLKTTGYGELKPIASNSTAENRTLNRRVEIQIVPNRAS